MCTGKSCGNKEPYNKRSLPLADNLFLTQFTPRNIFGAYTSFVYNQFLLRLADVICVK